MKGQSLQYLRLRGWRVSRYENGKEFIDRHVLVVRSGNYGIKKALYTNFELISTSREIEVYIDLPLN